MDGSESFWVVTIAARIAHRFAAKKCFGLRYPHSIFALKLSKPASNNTVTAAMAPNMSLFSVNAILILAVDDSSRILAKCDYHRPSAVRSLKLGQITTRLTLSPEHLRIRTATPVPMRIQP